MAALPPSLITCYCFDRNVLQPIELLEDVEECGIPGSDTYTPKDTASSRSESDPNVVSSDRQDEATIQECLWDCEWIENPFYKKALVWRTKFLFTEKRDDTASYALLTSPMVPRDLTCLKDCFSLFPSVPTFSDLQKQCSDQGFDRLVPTYTELGRAYIESNYTETSLILEGGDTSNYATASLNPNLDCLEWIWKQERQKTSEDNLLSKLPETLINILEPSGTTEEKSDELELGQNVLKNSILEAVETSEPKPVVDLNWWWMGTDQLSNNVQAIHKRRNQIRGLDDWETKIFRASNPVAKAVEICVLAQILQLNQEVNRRYSHNLTHSDFVPIQSPFGTGRKAVCGDFLPDIFHSTSCNCVGRCGPDEKEDDKIKEFNTVEGLVACQNACKEDTKCNFYTHAEVINRRGLGITVSVCSLWKTCKNFNVGNKESHLGGKVLAVSRLWTGAKNCTGFSLSSCPLRKEV